MCPERRPLHNEKVLCLRRALVFHGLDWPLLLPRGVHLQESFHSLARARMCTHAHTHTKKKLTGTPPSPWSPARPCGPGGPGIPGTPGGPSAPCGPPTPCH